MLTPIVTEIRRAAYPNPDAAAPAGPAPKPKE